MLSVLMPSTVRPPNPKNTACSNSPTKSAGKAAHPKIRPASPLSIKCTEVGPIGTWINEATKNDADKTPVAGIRSIGSLRRPMAMPATAMRLPPMTTGFASAPSTICIAYSRSYALIQNTASWLSSLPLCEVFLPTPRAAKPQYPALGTPKVK